MRGRDLYRADLAGADLRGADLAGADLRVADLRGADLAGADLRVADLAGADLRGADLTGADLTEADLAGADLRDVKGLEHIIATTRILPADGDVIGWKKCRHGVVVKLRVPAEARRSHAFGRKCRAEFVDVLEVINNGYMPPAPVACGISLYDSNTIYRVGERVRCDEWCEDWVRECAGGIHFFITREEAEAY